jgi:hypothetical protein
MSRPKDNSNWCILCPRCGGHLWKIGEVDEARERVDTCLLCGHEVRFEVDVS